MKYKLDIQMFAETWVINESPTLQSGTLSFDVNFVSSNQNFTHLASNKGGKPPYSNYIRYDATYVYNMGSWVYAAESFRTVTFETAPTGDLLTWLQENAVKQSSLQTPTLIKSSSNLIISNIDENATSVRLYKDNVLFDTINISTLSGTATNCTINSGSSYSNKVTSLDTTTLNVTADGTSYKLPTKITVASTEVTAGTETVITNKCTVLFTRTSDTSGSIAFSNVSDDVAFSAVGEEVALTPLCFTANTAGSTVGFDHYTGLRVAYSYDGQTWLGYNEAITLTNIGDKVYFKGELIGSYPYAAQLQFAMTGSISASGNALTMLSIDGPLGWNDFNDIEYFFAKAFMSCTALTTIPIIAHPDCTEVLPEGVYAKMFDGCTSLTSSVIDLSHVWRVGEGYAKGPGTLALAMPSPSPLTIKLSPELAYLNSEAFTLAGTAYSSEEYGGVLNIIYDFTENDVPKFELANVISKGGLSGSYKTYYLTYNIYTDNTAIKNACLANADEYTTVNVYHLDGSEWEA